MLNPQEFKIKQWEAEVLIASLLKLTRSGSIVWECLEYSPPMLIETDDLFISHELIAKTEYEGDPYLAEISDTVDVKTGKGKVDLSTTIGDEPESREDALDRYIPFFPEEQTIKFANLLFLMLEDDITNSPAWSAARYSAQRFSPEAATAPLSILGRNLFEHKQALVFHQICTDEVVRNSLIEEQASLACGSRTQCCCFSGHRPEKLSATEAEIRIWLEEQVRNAVLDGFTTFISGMARGVDLWAGEVVLKLKAESLPIRLVCASPFPGFETGWAKGWQTMYHDLLFNADAVAYISPSYTPYCFQKRNRWMVDRSSRLIAVYNGTSGGTKNTIDYARKQGCDVIL